MKKFVIIDTPALLHRAWHAIPPLKDKNGRVVNALYGFLSILMKAIGDLKPDYLALTFDRKEPTFRHKEFKDYKAQRVRQPQEFYDQFPLAKEAAAAFGIPVFEMIGFEADDLIGTLTDLAEKNKDVESIVVTGDLDTLQLVDDQTKVLSLKKGVTDTVLYDEAAVRERYGLNPDQLIDYKALRGDPSDNIPGVKGIGEKGAAELIKEFGSLEKIYEYLESSPESSPFTKGGKRGISSSKKIHPHSAVSSWSNDSPSHSHPAIRQLAEAGRKASTKEGALISERVAELLREQKDGAMLSKHLVTIVRDVPVDFNLEDCAFGDFDREKIIGLFEEFGFKSLIKRLPGEKKDESQSSLFGVTPPNLSLPPRRFGGSGTEVVRGESESLPLGKGEREGVTIVNSKKDLADLLSAAKRQKEIAIKSFIPPFIRGGAGGSETGGLTISWENEVFFIPQKNIVETQGIASLLENENIKKICHNYKSEIKNFDALGVKLAGVSFDLMLAAYLLNPGERASDLETIIFSELGETARAAVAGTNPENLAAAASYIYKLAPRFAERLKEADGEKVFNELELPLSPVLARMEKAGILLDIPFLKNLSAQFEKRLSGIQKEAFELAGESFNLNSPKQIKEILFEKLKIGTAGIRKTKTGLSTAAAELEKLRGKHPLIDLIFEHRELAKLKSTYLDALPALADNAARVRTSFNQTVTSTGRLSSSNPNLQNIPTRTDLGKEIRKAFIAPKGWKLISADYSQIELRIVASLANDQEMIAAFSKNEDIHTHTASEIWGVPHEKVTPEMRRAAKAVNFGIVYGIGPQGLAEGAGISFNEARDFIKKYFAAYSGIKNYLDETKALARSLGYVETLFHRRRYLPEIVSEIPQVRAAAERMAINMPVQGTAADIIKMAMIKVDVILRKMPEKIRMLLQVHDELVFEVREDFVRDAGRLIRDLMETTYKLKVPIKVDVEVGQNWGEMEKI